MDCAASGCGGGQPSRATRFGSATAFRKQSILTFSSAYLSGLHGQTEAATAKDTKSQSYERLAAFGGVGGTVNPRSGFAPGTAKISSITHAAEEPPSTFSLSEEIPSGVRMGRIVRSADERDMGSIPSGDRSIDRFPEDRGSDAANAAYHRDIGSADSCGRGQQGGFSVPHSLDRNRSLARDRI